MISVDHCGHRLGADHPETDAKLQQMNGFLGALLPRIDDDTVLFVFGDHGMLA